MINIKNRKTSQTLTNTFQIRKATNEEIDKLSIKLKDPSICRKDWWKTLNLFIKPDQESVLPLKNKALFIVMMNIALINVSIFFYATDNLG